MWSTTALFFVSYMLVCSLVLVNIIIAVLLDEFLTTMGEHRAKTALLAAKTAARPLYLDPLMEPLSKFQCMDDQSTTSLAKLISSLIALTLMALEH